MSKDKRRWNKIRSAQRRGSDNFRFETQADGRVVFFRGSQQFSWEPLQIDRETAREFVGKMNTFRGRDVERYGRPYSLEFIRIQRKAAIDRGFTYSGPADPGNAKGNHGTTQTE